MFHERKDLPALHQAQDPVGLKQRGRVGACLAGVFGSCDPHRSRAPRSPSQESLRLAKETVKLEMTSGDSWYVLGNAYVASFFKNSRAMKDLDRALQAYAKAVSSRQLGVQTSESGDGWMCPSR